MKKHSWIRISIVVALVLVTFLVYGFAKHEALGKEVSVTVEFDAMGEWNQSYQIKAKEGSTVFSVTEDCLDQNGIPYRATGVDSFVYYASINGYREKTEGAYSGWTYSVNGEYAQVGSGQYIVSEDMTITWEYVTYE